MHLRRPLMDVALAARRHVAPPVTRDETEAPFRTSFAIFVCVVALVSSTACASAEVREDGPDAPRVLVRVAKIQFVMAGIWTINITASRPDTQPLRKRLRVEIPLDEPLDAPRPS